MTTRAFTTGQISQTANATAIAIGNSTVNTTINSTAFSGTANNANNFGGSSTTTWGNYITGNAATAYTNAATNASYIAGQAYSNAVANAAAVYQTTAGLSANVLLLTSNATTYLGNSSGTIGNVASWITGNAATAYTNATTYLTAGGYTISGAVTHSGNIVLTSGNATNQLLISTINATSIGLLANSTLLTIGNSTINTSVNATAHYIYANATNYIAVNATTISTGNTTVNSSINATALVVGSNVATFGTAVYHVANGNVGIGTSSPTAVLHVPGSSSTIAAIFTNIAEPTTVSATAATGTIALYPSTQSILYYTSNASANWTTNITFSSGTTMNTAMSTGQTMTVTFWVTQGATAYYNSVVQVDGGTVTPKWQGGTAPTAGNANSVDIYTYTVIKTGSAAFTVFASQTQFK